MPILGFDADFGQISLIFDTDFGNYLYLCPHALLAKLQPSGRHHIVGIGTSGIIVSAADIPLLPLMNIE